MAISSSVRVKKQELQEPVADPPIVELTRLLEKRSDEWLAVVKAIKEGNTAVVDVLARIADKLPETGAVLKRITPERNAEGYVTKYELEWDDNVD